MRKLFLSILFLLPVLYFAQCPSASVSYTVDLSSSTDTTWTTPSVARSGYACAASGAENCISLVVTINPATTVVNFNISSGALPPGSLYYQVDCGALVTVGQPSCVSGLTTFCLSFCKPGNNINTYTINVSKNYHEILDTITPQNCSKMISVNELQVPTIVWSSVFPGTPGQYDSYLSCTSVCNSTTILPTLGAPSYIDYKITGSDSICSLPIADTFRVIITPPIDVAITSANISCNGLVDGSATANVSGATLPISYLWSNGGSSTSLSSLPSGTYTVNVTDANMCVAASTVIITEPASLSIALSPTGVNCGQTNATISSSVTGGIPPYNYMWSNGGVGTTADSLSPGLYKLEILDANGCQGMSTAVVAALDGTTISLNTLTNVSCYGGSDGSISTVITGGTAPLTILWNNGSTSNTITNVQAGVYDLDVIDNTGCKVSASFVVNEPNPFVISEAVTNATCGLSDGSISTSLSGGTPGYTYSWSANAGSVTTPGANLLPAGFYTLTVTDAQACIANKVISVANTTNNISVVLNSIQPSTCGNPLGAIDLSVGGIAPPFDYIWTNGQVSEDMINAMPGNYGLMVSDTSSCNFISSYVIPSNMEGYTPQICMVTVNDTSNLNRVIWEKQFGLGIMYYNIYRETSVQGNYLRIASIPFDSLSVFQDTVANTNAHSWRYKLSAIDSCGNETEKSDFQKTIHRVVSPNALTGNVVLNWDYYDGAQFNQYYIYRELGMDWELIDSVSSATLTYVDIAPPLIDLDYRIDADMFQSCNPTLRLNGNNNIQTQIVKSKSNIKNQRTVGTKDSKNQNERFKVYPNPAHSIINVELKINNETATITIENMLGQIVFETKTTQQHKQLNISTFVSGVYFVKVNTGKGIVVEKVIIE